MKHWIGKRLLVMYLFAAEFAPLRKKRGVKKKEEGLLPHLQLEAEAEAAEWRAAQEPKFGFVRAAPAAVAGFAKRDGQMYFARRLCWMGVLA